MAAPSPDATRDACRQRLDEALSFLAHDARDGYATTIALMELQRARTSPLPPAELIERIERNAQRVLQAIDDYVEVAHARDRPLLHEPLDLADTHVSRLRTKLNLLPQHGYRLAAIYSVGYRLEDLRAAGAESTQSHDDAEAPLEAPAEDVAGGATPAGEST